MTADPGRYPLVRLERALAPRPRPNLVIVLWRWRYEVLISVSLGMAMRAGMRAAEPVWPLTVALLVAAATVGCAAWPTARRLLVARVWCVITPHRIRHACAEAWIYARSGKLPMVLWTSSEPYGERVILWSRAGTVVEDFEVNVPTLATTCWAREVQVLRHPTRPHIVTLLVIRFNVTRPRSVHLPARDREVVLLRPPADAM